MKGGVSLSPVSAVAGRSAKVDLWMDAEVAWIAPDVRFQFRASCPNTEKLLCSAPGRGRYRMENSQFGKSGKYQRFSFQ